MKKIEKNLLIITITTIILILLLCCKAEATGTFSATASTSLEPNGTTNLSISTSGCAGQFSVKSSNPNVVSVSSTNTFVDGKSMDPGITLTARAEGTATITVTATDVVDDTLDYNQVTGSKTINITVKAKETPKPPDGGNTESNQGGNSGNTENNGNTTSKPPVTEPKFTSVSKTVYATGDINLRSTWSTSSSATKVAKGTELRLTGTSTEKVNGYVWYRVTYNGQIKYVVNNLVTEKKPEEKSNNTNLKTLSIENVELSPVFSADVLQYTGKINGYEEKEIKVIAEAEDTKSTVKVEGNTNIVVGENIITAEVTAEDGTKKTYKIILTNKKETTSLALQSLKIKDVDLKGFSPDKFEYEVSFKDLEKLEIEAIANEEGAIIEISGNENLIEDGEHLITIMVSSADGTRTVNYQIKANKLKQEAQNIENKLNIKNIIIYGAIALVILVLIILLIVKYVKRK